MKREEMVTRRKDAADRVAAGEDPGEIATQLGVSLAFVRLACREHQVSTWHRHTDGRKSVVIAVVAALLNTAETQRQIAERLGASESHVNKIYRAARKAGIQFPNRE